ncbi:beta glucosidase 11 isoform X2 [Tasmannia lanceolata]|uniref:beta glucosidase 11 isoform X2 n=1 Tax=Tasmannia lanceolata TaxID=3420 RepID=UPI004064ADEC
MRVSSKFLLLSLLAEVCFGKYTPTKFSRNDFPSGFVFGAGTSAYQVEGAAAEDGRTPSIWDTFANSGKLPDKSSGNIASDEYHKYKEDVQLMKEMGLDAYRFSIAWSRLLPNGRGAINPKGLQYYNNLINELISNGIQPHVTLFHYDIPQALEDEYRGWLSPKIVKDFKEFADVCFREFGDRVSHWTTLNEANIFVIGGYDSGIFPPKRCSYPYGFDCTGGNSSLEPYMAGHNCLLAHAAAATLYKKKYQAKQHGLIGLSLLVYWLTPLTNSEDDVRATQRANDFYTGWFVNPLVFGDYPDTMKKIAGPKIPSFTKYQSKQLMGSSDFIGVNHYRSMNVKHSQNNQMTSQRDFLGDMFAETIEKRDGTPVGEFPLVPSGMQGVLEYFKEVYGNPPIYIHENGYSTPSNETLDDDTRRVTYLSEYMESMLNAIRIFAGMDQIQEDTSYGPSWTALSYLMDTNLGMVSITWTLRIRI